MKPTFISNPGFRDLPISPIKELTGEFYLMGAYATELSVLLEPHNSILLSTLTDFRASKFTFRNLIISDYDSANQVFWNSENSRIRMLATNALIVPFIVSPITYLWGHGFSSFENSNDSHWHWSVGDDRHGFLHLYNWEVSVRKVYVDFTVESNFNEVIPIKVDLNNVTLLLCKKGERLSLSFNLLPGENILKFTVPKSASRTSENDSRKLNFRILNFLLTDEHSSKGTSDHFARWKLHEEGFPTVLNLNSGLETTADGFNNDPGVGSSKAGFPASSISWYLALAF
jgi:hypothetical protein